MQWSKGRAGLKGFLIGLAVVLSSCVSERSPLEIEHIITSQVVLYPDMEVQDWYKLLHQASMGNRHLGVEDSLIHAYLLGEWERIEASDTEPLIEYITPDSSVVRLNLRPYKASGGSPGAVFEAMKNTWDAFVPSETRLTQFLGELQAASKRKQVGISEDALLTYIKEMQEEGYPAVHHSEKYAARYNPAYRVLDRRYIP